MMKGYFRAVAMFIAEGKLFLQFSAQFLFAARSRDLLQGLR